MSCAHWSGTARRNLLALAAAGSVAVLGPAPAQAQPPAEARTIPRSRLLLDTGRLPISPPNRETLRLQLHGEYQARLSALSDLPLRPHPRWPNSDSLGQDLRLVHWGRITPLFQIRDQFQVVGQVEVPRGLIAAKHTHFAEAADEPLDRRQPLGFDFRWLYAEWRSPVANLRAGQQPSHLGLGIVENDGDHPTLFGDYHGGNRVERLQLLVKPHGADSRVAMRLAGDLVYADPLADLGDGDVALRGVLSGHYRDRDENFFTFYGAFRHQSREDDSLAGFEFHEQLNWFTMESSGRFQADLPGIPGWVFAEYEVGVRLGSTTILRTVTQQRDRERERIQAHGAVARVGAVTTSGSGRDEWAHFVGMLEWGWASGDADPYDGTYRRFDFNPNHNVGLVLFDEVLAWKTARSASLAQDPTLTGRPIPGSGLLPSNGAVFGATYVYPSFVYRPIRSFDLRLAALVAQATADLVDPMFVATDGVYRNYDGGNPTSHDLGLELDSGIEYRHVLPNGITWQFGAQGGVFFPGNAFADARGNRMSPQYLGVGRLGLLY